MGIRVILKDGGGEVNQEQFKIGNILGRSKITSTSRNSPFKKI